MKTCQFGRARLHATVSAFQSISSSCVCHPNDTLSHNESSILFSVPGVLARISRLYNLWHGWSTWILHPGPAFPVVTSYFRDISNAVAVACNLHNTVAGGDDTEDFFWVNPPLELASSSRATPSDVDVNADAGAGSPTRTSGSFTTTVSISQAYSGPWHAEDRSKTGAEDKAGIKIVRQGRRLGK
ncbi:hypothetical protein VaNZ11_001548 [Volvox africanus]|uniref:DDE Tnp4 domain-containing protein n=1 Tax=Volvox africanus TaxID=51714 RepID=A0ABQ5RR93_9CHLO|nr:hypothetical protein VaNZ11_001548 [Volvox africanus]